MTADPRSFRKAVIFIIVVIVIIVSIIYYIIVFIILLFVIIHLIRDPYGRLSFCILLLLLLS